MEWSDFLTDPYFWVVFSPVSLLLGYLGIFIFDYRSELANTPPSPLILIGNGRSRKHRHIVVMKEKNSPDIRMILMSIFTVSKQSWRDSRFSFVAVLIFLSIVGSLIFAISLFPRKILDHKIRKT